MDKEDKTERRESTEFFHEKPCNWNCAQSVLKGFQKASGLTDEEIETEFRPMGGGRSPQGYCGALYAANYLMEKYGKEEVTEEFEKVAGSRTCKGIKGEGGTKYPCMSCVKLADKLVEERLPESVKV